MMISRIAARCFPVLLIVSALVAQSFASDPGKLLVGKWKISTPARDASGNPCPFVPDEMEFSSDGTMSMSNMPGSRVPFKIRLTREETLAMESRDPSLKGKSLLLVKPVPQMDWGSTPMVYRYSVTTNTLTLSVTGWTPATFSRVK